MKEGKASAAAATIATGVSEEERAVLKLLSGDEAVHLDALSEATGRPVRGLAGVLPGLEMRELVGQFPGKCSVRKPWDALPRATGTEVGSRGHDPGPSRLTG